MGNEEGPIAIPDAKKNNKGKRNKKKNEDKTVKEENKVDEAAERELIKFDTSKSLKTVDYTRL